jgi:hypothetical protein
VEALDLPDEPDRPERAEGGTDRPRPHEMPDPDERERVYDAARARASADTPAGAEPAERCGESGRSRYRDDVPRFLDMWADHEKHWPAPSRAPVDRSVDQPDLDAAAANAAGRMREVEPRISADAQASEQENDHGGWLEGFKSRLKREDRLKEKIGEQAEAEPGKSLDEISSKIPDAIRFTFCFQPDTYTRGYYDIKEQLESRSHEMYYSKNWWTNPEYKGINTRWVTEDGQRFEVQFHTPDSFHAKHYVTHAAYERIRDQATTRSELRELHAFQKRVSSCIRIPDGAEYIPDLKKEGF